MFVIRYRFREHLKSVDFGPKMAHFPIWAKWEFPLKIQTDHKTVPHFGQNNFFLKKQK